MLPQGLGWPNTGALSPGIVEDDAESVAVPGAYRAHPVPDSHAMVPTRTLCRSEVNCEQDSIAFAKLDNVRA